MGICVPVMDYQVDLNCKRMNDVVSKFELAAHLVSVDGSPHFSLLLHLFVNSIAKAIRRAV